MVGVPRTAFRASSLPAGLSIDGFTGDIFGTPTEPVNSCRVTVTAFNGTGECVATVDISVTAETRRRDRDRAELSVRLEAAAASNNQHVELQTATGTTVKTGDKYLPARLLEYVPAQVSTLGLINFMGVDQASFFVRYTVGVDEMVREVKDRSQVEEKHTEIENDRRETRTQQSCRQGCSGVCRSIQAERNRREDEGHR